MASNCSLPFVYISGEEVRRLVGMAELIEEMARGLRWVSERDEGGVVQPVRTVVRVDKYCGLRGVPSHQAIVIVLDPRTGTLQAIVDGVEITNMRTAAASACAARVRLNTSHCLHSHSTHFSLSPPPQALLQQAPRVLCIVGSGVQARSHAEALRIHHSFSEVRIWGRSAASAQRCADEVRAKVSLSLPDALRDADVVVAVTLATEPLIRGEWLKTGAVVISVGACHSDWRELDDDVMLNSLVTVDSCDAAMKESGDIIQSGAEIFAEIGEVISGAKPLPSLSDCGKKFLMFKSLGMAIEDVLSGTLIYHRFMERQTSRQPT
ncbi:Ketimine reductase mu-crystallin [Geodia barretti]|uniref:Ketimine reductase mu-crystallin n=1 Tax=Geodia barretti TaxID=519541 RepID=A0AA35R0I0_GEOBA|nr:Ketimine reductase mu-crystallin [Geodia barretti]